MSGCSFISIIDQRPPSRALLSALQVQKMPILISCEQRANNQAFKIMDLKIQAPFAACHRHSSGQWAFARFQPLTAGTHLPDLGDEITGLLCTSGLRDTNKISEPILLPSPLQDWQTLSLAPGIKRSEAAVT